MLTIYTVCGAGLGSSLACQMSVQQVIKKLGVKAKVDHTDISSAASTNCDLILAGSNFEKQFGKFNMKVPVVFLDHLVDKKEIEERLVPALKELGVL